jgi:hypothetical protein
MGEKYYFDIDQMLVDLGGIMQVSRTLGVPRVYVWTWRKEGRLPAKRYVEIKEKWPRIRFDKYFKPVEESRGEGHQ